MKNFERAMEEEILAYDDSDYESSLSDDAQEDEASRLPASLAGSPTSARPPARAAAASPKHLIKVKGEDIGLVNYWGNRVEGDHDKDQLVLD